MDKTTHLGLARDLLVHLETYLHGGTDHSWPHDFGTYLASLPGQTEGHPPIDEAEGSDAVALGATLVAFGNVVRRRASRALRESPFATIMDYQFLFVLQSHGAMSKSALIEANGMETSSGTEVIKRLLREGWITEEPNPDDGRSVLVHLTERGKAVEADNREHVSELYTSLSEPLDRQHRAYLLQLVHTIVTNG
jgi:DNA-binding MarR family transcriptional regulator